MEWKDAKDCVSTPLDKIQGLVKFSYCLPANYSSLFSAVLAQVNGCHNFSDAS